MTKTNKLTNADANRTTAAFAATLRSVFRGVAWALSAALVCAAFGCAGSTRDGGGFFARRRAADVPPDAELSQTETLARVDGRVAKLRLSKDSRRALVELYANPDGEADSPEYSAYFNSGGRFVPANPETTVELWNVEFGAARRESFAGETADVPEPTRGSAAFDDENGRVFWTARGVPLADSTAVAANETSGENDKTANGGDLANIGETGKNGATVPASVERSNGAIRPANALFANGPIGTAGGGGLKTILATRKIDDRLGVESTTALRLKTASDAQNSAVVWTSPGARWLVCRVEGAVDESADRSDSADAVSDDPAKDVWRLVSRGDRRRVVRFPVVKMTFDSSTSDETIEGRVVDALAITDAGDLAATLVEEIPPTPKNSAQTAENAPLAAAPQTAETTQSAAPTAFAPRYKIVIWDLSVAESIDLEKFKKPIKPLKALEVAQIPLDAPVSRRFCQFSPDGRILATRLEPRCVVLWQAANGRLLTELGEHQNDVRDFAFSPSGVRLAAGTGGKEGRVVVWDVRKGAAFRALDEYQEGVRSVDAVTYSADGNYVYYANDFGEIKRWDVRLKNSEKSEKTSKSGKRKRTAKTKSAK